MRNKPILPSISTGAVYTTSCLVSPKHARRSIATRECWLLRGLRAKVHTHLGYGSFGEYVERLFAYTPRWTHERLRVAEPLERLPAMARALRDGELSWSAARELTRVAAPEHETEWLEAAGHRTLREVEESSPAESSEIGPMTLPMIACAAIPSASTFRAKFSPSFVTRWPR